MAKIPVKDKTIFRLNAAHTTGYGRGYLGMSSVGEECLRRRFYGFHWVKKGTTRPRIQRIFNMGHAFEEILISELKAAGIEVFKVIDGKELPMTGAKGESQEEFVGCFGHAKGHPDGRVRGLPESDKVHLLEIKTMADQYWQDVVANGVEEANPKYYDQCQRYMPEMGLERTLFIAVNKNTSHYHIERIPLKKNYINELKSREVAVVTAETPPRRAFNEDSKSCRMCGFRDICWNNVEPEANCRTCVYADIEMEGKWSCQKKPKHKDIIITDAEQRVGCDKYEKGWGL